MLSIFRHGTGQPMSSVASSQVIAANHSPTDSDPTSGKTSLSLPPSECRSSAGSSSPTHSLESPRQHSGNIISISDHDGKNNGEMPEDLSLPRRTSTSSQSPSPSLDGFVKCSQCLCEFANESLLQLHIVTRHSLTIGGGGGAQEDDQSVRCQYCGVLLLDPNYLQKHMEDAHGHQQPFQNSKVAVHDPIKCPECNQSFPNELMLRGHLFDSHMSFSGPPMSFSEFGQKSSTPVVDSSLFSTNVFCSLCKRNFANEVDLWTHMRFQHLHDTAAVNTLLNLQTQNGNGSDLKGEILNNDTSPTKFGENINIGNQQNKIFNLEAYCELCDKEFCNKYFLKTHKANKHGVFCDDLSPASMVMAQKGPLSELSNSVTTPPLTNSVTTSTPIDSLAYLKNAPTSTVATTSIGLTDQMLSSSSPNQASLNLPQNFSSSADLFCPLCRQFFPNPLFLQSHMITAHGGGVHFGANFSPNAMYAMMGAAAVNPFLQQMKFLNPHMAAAMFGMIPPAVPGSPQLHLPSSTQTQSTPTNVLEYHLAANSGQNDSRKLDFGGTNGTSSSGVTSMLSSSNHKDAFCELCQKEFCNKYFLKTHKLNKHGILDDSFGESPSKKMKSSPDMYHANEALGLEAGEITKERPLVDGSFNGDQPKISPLSEALNKPPVSNLKLEMNDGHQPSAKIAKLDLNGNGTANGVHTPDAPQQQVSCTLCMKSFPSLFALVAHKYRDHGSFDGNINALAAAMNVGVGGQSSPILAQIKMDSSPQRVSNGSAGATSAVPSSVDPDAYCEICKKEFCSKYFLRTHKLNIHGIVMECSPTQTTNGHGAVTSVNRDSALRTPRPLVTGKNFCDICNKELCNKYFLRTHMLKMHGIVIDENKTVIGNINSLDKDVHQNQILFRCDICNKELGTRQQLKIHKQSVHFVTSSSPPNSGGTPCSDVSNKLNATKDVGIMPPNVTISILNGSKCSSMEGMQDQSSTNHDLAIDHDDTLNNHNQYSENFDVCTLCNQRFKNAKWLSAHMITDHDCLHWQDTFLQPANNLSEQNNSHLPCEYCSEEFADQVELQMHVIDAHQREVQGKATSLAEQTALDNIGAFADQTDTPVSDSAEACDLTTVGVGDNGKVYRHNNEQNICATVDEIASGVTQTTTLPNDHRDQNRHQQTDLPMVARNNNGTKMYKCSYCNYYTRWISNLSTHEKRHNATHQLNGCDRPFVCRVCLRAYRYAHSLQRHMEVHRLSSYGMQMQMNASVLNGTSSTVSQNSSAASTSTITSSPKLNGTNTKTDSFPTVPYVGSPRKTLSDNNSIKQYQCNLCEKSFGNKELYRMHLLSIHKTSPPKENTRHQNGACSSNSASSTLANGFSPSSSSTNTNLMVSPKKIYRCKICGVGARVYQELCLHLVETHGITPKQKSSSFSPKKDCQMITADINGTSANVVNRNQIENLPYSESVPKTPEPKNGKEKLAYPISHGTPQRLAAAKTPAPFVMQPFLMKESVDSGIFVPSVVYLPIMKEIDGVVEAKFTFYPIRTSDIGNADPSEVKRNDQTHPSTF